MVREYRDYQVNCLREPGRIEHVQIIIEADNGTLIPLESRGCEQASACPECNLCRAALPDMVFHNPNLPTHIPVTPKLLEKA
nr:MAG TPA: hypothetical protein [Bacteriophage sp.]